jgi:hypothetical protein
VAGSTIVLDADTFSRANAGSWTTASSGSTWSASLGTPTLSIASNEGHATNVSAQAAMRLGSITSADAEGLVRVQTNNTSSNRMGVMLRQTATNTFYHGRLSANANNLTIGKVVTGTNTDLFTTAFTTSIATFYWVRFRIVGTHLAAKAWADGSGEPGTWTLSGIDSSIAGAGNFGLTINSTSTASTFDFDSFTVTDASLADTLSVRARIRTQISKTLSARTRLRTLSTKSVGARLLLSVSVLATKSLAARLRLMTKVTKSLQTRVLLKTQITKSVPTRFLLSNTQVIKTLSARLRLITLANKTISARVRLSTTGLARTLAVRVRIRTQVTKTSPARFLMRTSATKSLSARTRVRTQISKTLQSRTLIRTLITRTLPARTLVATSHSPTLQARTRLKTQIVGILQIRAIIGTSGIASGKFALWANGAGTAQFDFFRVNEYPDPALSMAPIVPRAGATGITWNALVPSNTTLGVDVSYDGVSWIDVSSSNGGSLPALYSQPDPVIDSFSINSSTSYASTNKAGGSTGTWTYDTANSRLTATGGNNAIYTSIIVSRADIDFFVDMDRADAGGVVWRFVDPNNFYLCVIGDSLSNISQNTLTLYKIVAGVQTLLGSTTIAFTRGMYRRLRISMLTSAIVAYLDGVQMLTMIDTGIAAAGRVGFYNNGGVSGSRYYQLWIQPQGDVVTGAPATDVVTGTFAYTRLRLATTDPSVTPQVEDVTTFALSPQIGAGALIPDITYDNSLVSKDLDDLSKQSNYSWYVDTSQMMVFRAFATVPAPWILQSTAAGLAMYSDIEINSDLELDVENDLYRTRQIIIGAQDTVTPPPANFIGDGSNRSFTLGYPLAAMPTVTLNGITQTLATKGSNNANFYYAINDPVLKQDSLNTVMQKTDVLIVAYSGLFDVTIVLDDLAEQAARRIIENGGTGIVEAVEDVTGKGVSRAAATTLANGLIARYANAGRTLIFDTSRTGLAIGQVLTIFLPEHGIWDGQFYIQSIEITLRKGTNDTQVWWFKVSASELPKKASWAKLIGQGLILSG